MRYEKRTVRRCGDGKWIVDVWDTVGSRRIRHRITAKDEASATESAEMYVLAMNGAQTVGESLSSYIAAADARVSPSTLVGYRSLARRMKPLAAVPIDRLAPEALAAFFDEMTSVGFSASIVSKTRNLCCAAFSMSVESGTAGTNPCEHVAVGRPIPVKTVLPGEDEAARLRSVIECMSGEIAAVFALALGCKLSIGEICALKRLDFRFDVVSIAGRASSGARGETALIRYSTPRIEAIPDWTRPFIDPVLSECSSYVFGGKEPASYDALSRKANGLLHDFGFDFSFSKIRRMGFSQEQEKGGRL